MRTKNEILEDSGRASGQRFTNEKLIVEILIDLRDALRELIVGEVISEKRKDEKNEIVEPVKKTESESSEKKIESSGEKIIHQFRGIPIERIEKMKPIAKISLDKIGIRK